MAKRPPRNSRSAFAPAKSQEREYYRQLRRIAQAVGNIVALHQDGAVVRAGLSEALARYADQLRPWAVKTAASMVGRVDETNRRDWLTFSTRLGRALKEDPALPIAQALQTEQVNYITSLPIEAGQRAQKLAQEAALGGRRADEVAAEIARTGEVTQSRAMLIARTEIAKANSTLTQARAESVGATHYIWRTADDGDVRPTHRALDGKIFAYADPPSIPGEGSHHPGQFPNCRCWGEPIIE